MHPIFSQTRRLWAYLLAWIPLAGVVIYFVLSRGGLRSGEAALLAGILAFIFAFVSLSAWYTARGTPLATTSFDRLAMTHAMAGALVSLLWVIVAKGLAYAFAQAEIFKGLPERLHPTLLPLWGVGVLLYVMSVAVHYAMLAMEASAQAEQREISARAMAREAELRALKAQINPHFLFNSLHSISALTSIDPPKAREMCLALSDFLRMTLGLGERNVILLSDELALLRSYLSVEKIRFGARLDMREEVDTTVLNCLVPPLLLQPLIENAVGHGIANLPQGGWIRMAIREDGGGNLLVDVKNNFDPDAPPRRKNGMGLRNVRSRLEARYGRETTVKITKREEQFEVELAFPAERATAS